MITKPEERCGECACGRASRQQGVACPFELVQHERGATLCREGDAAERVWFVRHGTVVLTRAGRARAVRSEGGFVGLEALVRPTYLDTARASSLTTACVAPLAQVDAWLGAPGTTARTALEQVLRSEAAEPLHAASPDGRAVARVARWVLEECGSQRGRELLRRDVAGLLGMAPETFSRALAELQEGGAIEATRRQLFVKDEAELRRLAGV